MPSLLTRSPLANRLSGWWWRHYSSPQWLVDREQIHTESYPGWRPRVVLSRSLCLFFTCDLARVPKHRRARALPQQVALNAPFAEPGHHVIWYGATACVWVWDQAALQARLPQSVRYQVVPDSALAPAWPGNERQLAGLQGGEWQRWQGGVLCDSRWLPDANPAAAPLVLSRRTPLRARDRLLLGHLGCALVAWCLLLGALWQVGASWRVISQVKQLSAQVSADGEGLLATRHARQRAEAMRRQFGARLGLFAPGQSLALPQLMDKLPATVTLLAQYDYQPQRVQLLLTDSRPDPRDYVNRLEGITINDRRLHNVQVQLESNQRVRLQADLAPVAPQSGGAQ